MNDLITSIGLMSGTSCDGIDASIIKSDGENELHLIGNQFLPYDEKIKLKIRSLKEKINLIKAFLIFGLLSGLLFLRLG